jgi:anti-sigma-K factor RskA
MSTHDTHAEATDEQLAVDLFDRLNTILIPQMEPEDAQAALLQREAIEVIGLLPYQLEEQPPSAATRERLMAAVRGEDVDQVGVPVAAPPLGGKVVSISQRTWQSRFLPLAAALIIALLGAFLWQQFAQLQDQQQTIDRLASQLSETNMQATQLTQYQEELETMQAQLALVTSQGVEVCALKPRYAAAAETNARGTLFVASDHQHWYLRIDDLEPCPLGRSYQLWFVTEDGTAVDGGVLQIEHGVELEVTSDSMPQGTVEVSITLEPAGGSTAPSGPLVLHGNEVMRLL